MKKSRQGFLNISTKAFIALVILAFAAVYGGVDDTLHPPRRIPQGRTLQKFNIPYQSLDLFTDDGLRLSAWYTPPRKGTLILLAHGYGNDRPEWIYEMLARKGYGVLA